MLNLQIKHLVWPFHHNSAQRRSCASDDDWRRRHFRTESLRCQRLGFLVQSCATKKQSEILRRRTSWEWCLLRKISDPRWFVGTCETATFGWEVSNDMTVLFLRLLLKVSKILVPIHQPFKMTQSAFFVSNIGCCLPRPISIPKMSGLQGNVWVRSIKREGLESKADVIVEAMEKAVG